MAGSSASQVLCFARALLQMNQQQRNAGGGDAGDARRHAERFRPVTGQLLTRFDRQGRHLHVVQVGRELQAFVVRVALNLGYQLAERVEAPAATPGGGAADAELDAIVRRLDAALNDDGQLL